ncbi:hypothetical protein [Pedobacter polysacchareus]|uniref:hypothetical protein n=1 Tax=Pedobacter polysacchareus TaxID=2861973 RepID=UPI001C994FD3|nr:hypothetical protein [Pedobacter polysacchareus]
MNEITKIENALEFSTAKDNLLDILGGISDYSLEKFLDFGDGIPIISYITKGLKASLAIRDFLFMEKVVEFLRTIGEQPTQERRNMIKKIQDDDSYKEKFGKVSLVAIERFDDVEKSKLLGQAARYLSMGEITFPLYKRISFILSRLYVSDIYTFAENKSRIDSLHFVADLEALGLVKTSYGLVKNHSDPGDGVGSSTKITDLGKLVKCIALKESLELQVPTGIIGKETFVERLRMKFP